MAHIEDRWQDRDKNRTGRWGTGKRYRARYADAAGRERSRSFTRKGDAETFLANVQADLLKGSYVDPDAGRVTLREYAGRWLDGQAFGDSSRETVERRLRLHMYPRLGHLTLAQLAAEPSLIQAWLGGMKGAAGQKRALHGHLLSVFDAALEDGRVTRNPVRSRSVRPPAAVKSVVVPWEEGRVAAVRAGLPPRFRAMADAGAALGLRQGEAFGLSPDDVEWLRGVVHVRRQVRITGGRNCFALPKGERERDIPLPESVKLILAEHLREFPARPVTLPWNRPQAADTRTVPLFFTTQRGTSLNRSWFTVSPWRAALKAAGVPQEKGNGFHALRHHFASVLIRDNVDVRALARYMGHHDPGFTLRVYGHLMDGADDRMRQAVDRVMRRRADGPGTARGRNRAV